MRNSDCKIGGFDVANIPKKDLCNTGLVEAILYNKTDEESATEIVTINLVTQVAHDKEKNVFIRTIYNPLE